MRSVTDTEVCGKRVLLRVDFNVPLADGTVTDDTRIRAALPTIGWLLEHGARVILMSHLGRPKGEGYEAQYSLAPVARVLGRLLGQEVGLVGETCGAKAREAAAGLHDGQVIILENLRFDAREKQNDPDFAAELADLAELYVNDAFGAAHRAHASVAGVAQLLPSYAGLLLDREVQTLTDMLASPGRPFVAILGGSKVSDKIKVITALIDVVDVLLIGGAMCFTFLRAEGYATGTSLVEPDWIERAREMMDLASKKAVKLLIPTDVVLASQISEDSPATISSVSEIPANLMGLDIGPATSGLYAREIALAQTVFWNGPMGVFECKPFAEGTRRVAQAVADNQTGTTIIGGGDSVAAIHQFNLANQVSFISTGGGASMQLIEGNPLPGVQALDRDGA